MSSDDPVPAQLPTLSEKLSAWLGFKLPAIPLPQTAKNLDKAFGRLVAAGLDNLSSRWERDTSAREARKTVDARIIEASGTLYIERLNKNTALAERAIDFSFSESVLKQRNRERILTLAVEDLALNADKGHTDAKSDIDDDWLNLFSDFCSQKSAEEVQILWGKILSGKIRNPNAFSLHSLQLLSAIDTRDAAIMHRILGFAIEKSFIFKNRILPKLEDIMICEDLGIVSGGSGLLSQDYTIEAPPAGFVSPFPRPHAIFHMTGSVLFAQFHEEKQFQIPCYTLTRFGVELHGLSEGFERDEHYERLFVDFLKFHGATVQRTDVGGGAFEDL